MRKFTRRQLILIPATILIVAGFLWLVGWIAGVRLFDLTNGYIWIRLPYHGYRIRLMYDESGRLQIRTFFGFWHDTLIYNYVNPFTLMLSGYSLLLGLLPDHVRSLRGAERIASGRCGKCNYDLTGNTTGIYPECGTPRNAR